MRIISKFHDYYDSVQAHGVDPKLIYKREQRTLEVPRNLWSHDRVLELARWVPRDRRWGVNGSIILFCGKAHPVWKCDQSWCMVPERIEQHLEQRRKRTDLRINEIPPKDAFKGGLKPSWWEQHEPAHCPLTNSGVAKFSKRCNEALIDAGVHVEFSAPVLLVTELWSLVTVQTNPCLKDFEFYKKVEPFTAFQEIAMYLGNELAQPDIAPQSVGGDDVIARAKGFDDKSFRTQAPGNKKLNRKANKARKKKA